MISKKDDIKMTLHYLTSMTARAASVVEERRASPREVRYALQGLMSDMEYVAADIIEYLKGVENGTTEEMGD